MLWSGLGSVLVHQRGVKNNQIYKWDGRMDGRLSPFDGMLRAPTVLIKDADPSWLF